MSNANAVTGPAEVRFRKYFPGAMYGRAECPACRIEIQDMQEGTRVCPNKKCKTLLVGVLVTVPQPTTQKFEPFHDV